MTCAWKKYLYKLYACEKPATIIGMCEGHTMHCATFGCLNLAVKECEAYNHYLKHYCYKPMCNVHTHRFHDPLMDKRLYSK